MGNNFPPRSKVSFKIANYLRESSTIKVLRFIRIHFNWNLEVTSYIWGVWQSGGLSRTLETISGSDPGWYFNTLDTNKLALVSNDVL